MFIFFLAAAPCCDGDSHEELATTVTLSAAHQDHDSHSHDVCSPFCTCASCGCHGFNVQEIALLPATPVAGEASSYKISTYTSQFISSFETSIWQPPRLS